jgi:hypothetical protein
VSAPSRLARRLSVVTCLPRYERSWVSADLLGGLTVWALIVLEHLGVTETIGSDHIHETIASAVDAVPSDTQEHHDEGVAE